MKAPSFLSQGDKIAIVATARKVSPEEMKPAIDMLNSWGFKVVEGMNLYASDRQFAGTDSERWADLQLALDDPSIKAILFARGGYGTVRIVDKLDFNKFNHDPKWLIGFSDLTILHAHINHRCKVQTLHAPMAINFPELPGDILNTLHNMLVGDLSPYHVKNNLLNRRGKAAGELIGGNLSVIYSALGSDSEILTKGKILFIEDLDEYLYHVDRMIQNLRRNGKLDGLRALIVGGMTEMNDNEIPYGRTAEEIVLEAVHDYDFPVCFGFPAGHVSNNLPLIFGRKIKLNVSEEVTLSYA